MASYDQLNERAFFLPVIAVILLTPPFLLLFNHMADLMGMPVLYLYAFGIWTALLIAGKLLSDRIVKAEAKEQQPNLKSRRNR